MSTFFCASVYSVYSFYSVVHCTLVKLYPGTQHKYCMERRLQRRHTGRPVHSLYLAAFETIAYNDPCITESFESAHARDDGCKEFSP